MAIYDLNYAREEIISHFNNVPKLKFDNANRRKISLEFPALANDYSYSSRRDSTNYNADIDAIPIHPYLLRFGEAINKGLGKLYYSETSDEGWHAYMRFVSDSHSLPSWKDASSSSHVNNGRHTRSDPINLSRDSLVEWFENDIVTPLLSGDYSSTYVIGDPGCGKSTALKYLLNTAQASLSDRGAVFSRFEFIKFMKRVYRDNEDLEKSLSNHLLNLCLRDLIYRYCYDRNPLGGYVRKPNTIFTDASAVQKLMVRLYRESRIDDDPEIYLHVFQSQAEILRSSIGPKKIDLTRLYTMKSIARVFITKYLASDCRLCLVFDGMDAINLADFIGTSERALVLRRMYKIAKDFDGLFNLSDQSQFSVEQIYTKKIFVVRENTLFLFRDEPTQVLPIEEPVFRVGHIPVALATSNMVERVIDIWCEQNPSEEPDKKETKALLLLAINVVSRILSRTTKGGSKTNGLYDLLNGNIRTLAMFIKRVLNWFASELLKVESVNVSGVTLNRLLKEFSSKWGIRLVRRRRYRLIELLLFSENEVPWFENTLKKPVGLAETVFSETGVSGYVHNPYFTGFVDNIYNFYQMSHVNVNSKHSILERLRIMQILKGRDLSAEAIGDELFTRFGYVADDLPWVLSLLLYSDYIKATVRTSEIVFMSTERGKIVAFGLSRKLAYIEHVFHQTMFPGSLLATTPDEIRKKNVEAWSAAAIRNCYLFLTYVSFVEDNRSNEKKVGLRDRVVDDIRSEFVTSISRMLSPDGTTLSEFDEGEVMSPRQVQLRQQQLDRVARRLQAKKDLANSALKMIGGLENRWRFAGVIA